MKCRNNSLDRLPQSFMISNNLIKSVDKIVHGIAGYEIDSLNIYLQSLYYQQHYLVEPSVFIWRGVNFIDIIEINFFRF